VTVGEALAHGTHVLAEAGIDSARLESELLLARACDDCARALLYMELRRDLSPEAEENFAALLARRATREPLAYILGHWGFRRLTLKTDRRALIPRPETEIVVERALEHLDGGEPSVLDVGTGTGAIALAIVDEHPRARVTAIDASEDALALARENLDLLGINGRVRLVEHDLTEGLGHDAFDLVVSNPPYIEPEDIETLQPEVRDWEARPRRSLARPRRRCGPAAGSSWRSRRTRRRRSPACCSTLATSTSGSRPTWRGATA
jgi:release factor glutamine methyltransferase